MSPCVVDQLPAIEEGRFEGVLTTILNEKLGGRFVVDFNGSPTCPIRVGTHAATVSFPRAPARRSTSARRQGPTLLCFACPIHWLIAHRNQGSCSRMPYLYRDRCRNCGGATKDERCRRLWRRSASRV